MRTVHLVPHTHWDREWYLAFEAFRERLVETLDLVLDLLAADEGWTHFHLDGQTAMIDDYLEVRPERESEVRALVEAGRLSCGPWVTLVDEFSVSGESIARNLEDGVARADELGGASRLGYLPDQFGHVGQMPQLLANAGIDRAVVWRGVPAAIDEAAFTWTAPDGSRVSVAYLPYGYGQGEDLPADPDAFAARVRTEVGRLAPFLQPSEPALLMSGGDHKRPKPSLPALAEASFAGGEVRMGDLMTYVRGQGPRLEHVGELRSAARANLLPNTYSARPHQKSQRARAEHLLERYAEPLAALVPGIPYPRAELAEARQLLHINGAHDSVCGCSTDEVAGAVDGRTRRVAEIARSVISDALEQLGAQVGGPGEVIFNPSPFERDGVPGLGWRVRNGQTARPERVRPRIEDDRIVFEVDGGALHLRVEDQADEGDLYTFCPASDPVFGKPTEEEAGARVEAPRFTARLSAEAIPGEGFARLVVVIENRAPDHRVRVLLALPQAAQTTRAGSAFEIVERPRAGEGGGSEPAPVHWPARGFVLAGGRGFVAEGVFEYELLGDELALTLMRCTGTISRARLATRKVSAGPDVPTPQAQLPGRHIFRFAVSASDPGEKVVSMWERYALPLMSAAAEGNGALPDAGSLLEMDVPALSSIRRLADDSIAVRTWNPFAEAVQARVGDKPVRLGPHRIETVTLEA